MEKAVDWSGKLWTLSEGADFGFNGVIAPPADPALLEPFGQALAIMRHARNVNHITFETNADEMIRIIARDTDQQHSASMAVAQ